MSRSVFIEGPNGAREFAEVETGQRALRVWNVNGGGGGGGGTEYARDSASGAADVGTQLLAVRNDTPGSLVDTDGDYAPLQVDSTGALRVNATFPSSLTVAQATHDDLNLNANVQQGDTDVAAGNALFVQPGTGAVFEISDGGFSISVDDGGGSLTVDVGNFPASQTVDDGGGSLTVDGSVSVSNFPAVQPVSDNGGSLTVDGSVSISALTPGTGATSLGKAEDAAHTSGDVGVMALAVRNDAGAALAGTDGDYIPLSTNNLGALRTTVNGAVAMAAQLAEDGGHISGDLGVMALAVRRDTPSSGVSADGDYAALSVDDNGALRVTHDGILSADVTGSQVVIVDETAIAGSYALSPRVENHEIVIDVDAGLPAMGLYDTQDRQVTEDAFGHLRITQNGQLRVAISDAIGISGMIPGVGNTQLGKAEDAAHTSGSTGVMALAVRNDAGTALAGTTGDYIPLTTDSLGRLWVRTNMPTIGALSGSTNGRPIQITGTGSGSSVTIHSPGSGNTDNVFLRATNRSDDTITLTLEWGTTGTANLLEFLVPANSTVEILNGTVLVGTDTITAYASTANELSVIGRRERQQ